MSLISDGVAQRDRTAHRMSDEDQWTRRLHRANRLPKPLQILDELIEPVDVAAFAVRSSVATMIQRVHDVTERNEPLDHVAVSSGMFGPLRM